MKISHNFQFVSIFHEPICFDFFAFAKPIGVNCSQHPYDLVLHFSKMFNSCTFPFELSNFSERNLSWSFCESMAVKFLSEVCRF